MAGVVAGSVTSGLDIVGYCNGSAETSASTASGRRAGGHAAASASVETPVRTSAGVRTRPARHRDLEREIVADDERPRRP